MAALKATSSCSVWRMSGRRSSSADGNPAGTSGACGCSVRLRPRGTGCGLFPSNVLMKFSCCSMRSSRSGMTPRRRTPVVPPAGHRGARWRRRRQALESGAASPGATTASGARSRARDPALAAESYADATSLTRVLITALTRPLMCQQIGARRLGRPSKLSPEIEFPGNRQAPPGSRWSSPPAGPTSWECVRSKLWRPQ